jgi:hypothetical protein
MRKFTVIYVDSFTMGSHQHSVTKMAHIEVETPQEAYDKYEGAAVFIFDGHLESV